MLKLLNCNLCLLCSRLRWLICRRSKLKVIIRRFGKSSSKARNGTETEPRVPASAAVHPNGQFGGAKSKTPLRIAMFNAAMFSMALVVPKAASFVEDANNNILKVKNLNMRCKSLNDHPNSILKQSSLHPNSMSSNNNNNNLDNLSNQQKFKRSKLRVSINLPDNEISLMRNRQLSFSKDEKVGSSSISRFLRGKAPLRSSVSFSTNIGSGNKQKIRIKEEFKRAISSFYQQFGPSHALGRSFWTNLDRND